MINLVSTENVRMAIEHIQILTSALVVENKINQLYTLMKG